MGPQVFTTYVQSDQKATYKLLIPVINNDNQCRLEIRDSNNSVLDNVRKGDNEFILECTGAAGEYQYNLLLLGPTGSNGDTILDKKQIIVKVLASLDEYNAKQSGENRALITDYIKAVNVESGVGMGGPWIRASNLSAVWRKVAEQFSGSEVDLLCDILESPQDFKIYWVALNFLNFSSQDISDKIILRHILNVACDHIPSGGHVQSIALQLVQSLNIPGEVLWKVLLNALKVTSPNMSMPVVKVIMLFVPPDGAMPTGNAILKLMRTMGPESYEILYCIEAIEKINFRDGAASLREQLIRSNNPQAASKIASLLEKWKDPEAAMSIRKYLDSSHTTATQLYILQTMHTLFRIEGPSAVPYIAEMLPRCQSFVIQNIGGDNLGELRYEPLIFDAIKEMASTSNDPNVKKALIEFINKTSNK